MEVTEEELIGLRERKKQRTRSMLIDAAVDLCLKQGYEQTTVDQIAAVADVSPRTFSRYFATKDAVMLTLLDDFVDAAAVVLDSLPAEMPAIEALKDAHVAVLKRAETGRVGRLTASRVVLMLQVINSSPLLQLAATDYRPVPLMRTLAARMGVEPSSRSIALVTAIWSAIIVTACRDLVSTDDSRDPPIGPQLMVDRINESFGEFVEMTLGLTR